MPATPLRVPESQWDEGAAKSLTEAKLLRYRSNLLGADLAVTNFGGGNTSAKIDETDPLTGETVRVLWVKGSGGDLGSMDLGGFSTLYLDKLRGLETLYRGIEHEDEMVGYLPHCTFALNPRAASIDTPLHTFLDAAHVDHTHPDAVIALAATSRSEELTEEVFGGRLGWLPWQRPGFDLGLRLRDLAAARPDLEGIVLEGHGLFTWADDARACYENTIRTIAEAAEYLNARLSKADAFGGAAVTDQSEADRRAFAARAMPAIRGLIAEGGAKAGHFTDAPEVLEFVGAADMARLAAMGTSCPDHFLRTKIRPLVIEPDRFEAEGAPYLEGLLSDYRDEYGAYHARHKTPDSPVVRDPNPVVYLMPGIGMATFAKDKPTARIASEFYANAIGVMRGAEAVDAYQGLPEDEAFAIEYWLLEEAKLKRMPPAAPFTGRVALVTGGAGGIGRATAERFLAEGACVVLCDVDEAGLAAAERDLAETHKAELITTAVCDVTSETAVAEAFRAACLAYGGVDVVVANAGLASSAPVEETTMELWRKNQAVLTDGYFLTAREAFRTMTSVGAIVFVASKNALAASPNASAYCTAKAAEVHLARCLALEGAPRGIRVNVVNPDAVLAGSKIWTGDWRTERAAAYGLEADDLEAHYRDRSLLKRSVLPQDVAEAIAFLASDRAAKSTGNILNVDAGNAAAFTR